MKTPFDRKDNSLRCEWCAAAIITALLVILHVRFWLNAGAFWRDEVNTINLAQSPSFAALTHDTFPVLLPLLVKLWSALGHSDLWLRSLGLIVGLGIIASFWSVARATRRPPLFSVVLFGLNLLLFRYGDSLRAYGLGTLFVVLVLAATWSLLQKPSWNRAALLALAAMLSVQTLYQNAVLVFAIAIGGFAVCARRRDTATALKILAAGAVAALSLLPYYHSLIGLPQAAMELRAGFSWFITNSKYQEATAYPLDAFSTVWQVLAAAVVVFTISSFFRKKSDEEQTSSDLSLFASVTLVAVVAAYLVFLWFASAGARSWYFMPPLALIAVCFDFGIPLAALPRLVRVTAFALLVGTAFIAGYMDFPATRNHFTNADRLASQLTAQIAPQDYILVTPWYSGITFARYYHGATPWDTLPTLADHQFHRYDLVLDAMKDTNSLAPVLEKASATLKAGHRVWVVGVLEWPPDVSSVPPVLPAAPLQGYGWSDLPYMGSWEWRTSFALAKHSDHFEPVSLPDDGSANFAEYLRLYQAVGWHE